MQQVFVKKRHGAKEMCTGIFVDSLGKQSPTQSKEMAKAGKHRYFL